MSILESVLIVDDSRVTRMFVERILMPHCRSVKAVEGPTDALEYLAGGGHVDLVISDVHMATGNGFELLRVLGDLASQPAVLLMTGREIEEADRQRAVQQGAIGFLRKPLRVRDILAAWEEIAGPSRRRHERVRGNARVVLRVQGEENEPLVESTIQDFSLGGAFITTEGPLPIGTPIELSIDVGQERFQLRGEVIRVQDPSWTRPGGVAVTFDQDSDIARKVELALDSQRRRPRSPARQSS